MTIKPHFSSLFAALLLSVVANGSTALAAPTAAPLDPGLAWNQIGCSSCHGDDGIYRDDIKGAVGKPVAQVARWIRNAPSIKPNTDMPSFAGQIDEPTSLALAEWVLARARSLP